jgi:hypothetical protein
MPWELIVVDNGSTDGTASYLAGVQDAAPVPVTVVTNPANRGLPAAVNQGLSVALYWLSARATARPWRSWSSSTRSVPRESPDREWSNAIS